MPDRPTPVLAADSWNENGDLIEACFRLSYLKPEVPTFDATYGRGIWWKKCRPVELITNDIDSERSDADHNEDFRRTTWASGIFAQIAYDPPYAATGGVETSTVKDFINRFGRDLVPTSAEDTQQLINDGLTEMHRICQPRIRGKQAGGIVLVKCMPYIWSGALWEGDVLTRDHAVNLGFEVLTKFIHVGNAGPQDPNRTKKCPRCDGGRIDGCGECEEGRIPSVQRSPYNNYSVLYVLRKR